MKCDIKRYLSIEDLLLDIPKNQIIGDNFIRAWSKINNSEYKTIICSISGGSDSDIVLDICKKCDKDDKIVYVFFDTGLEYQATKEHLKYLEEKYDIGIFTIKAKKSIPTCCKQYGQPFLSKQVSGNIYLLQSHGFEWEDEPLDILLERYCKWDVKKGDWVGCKRALRWWCNDFNFNDNHDNQEDKKLISRFNINYNKWLKEFMVFNPPSFKISNKCCYYAKELIAQTEKKEFDFDLSIVGVRKFEGGARASAYKNCFSKYEGKTDEYRPIFWYKNSDKKEYEEYYEIVHSKCYTEYGMKRTGCIGCPYSRKLEQDLDILKQYEPKLFVAACNIFKDSYEYTRQYREFCRMKKEGEKRKKK